MSNIAVWGEGVETGTRKCKTKEGKSEQSDAVYLGQERFSNAFMFHKT